MNATQPSLAPRPAAPEAGGASSLTPAVDIFESADEYRLVADLPGVAPDDVQLDLERDELTLFAKRSLGGEGQRLARGRRGGDFRRVFRIPERVDAEGVAATFEHGVLQVTLPKSEQSKPRRIAVEAMS